jgi:diguanylate cyclase (GGDEF)-like protein
MTERFRKYMLVHDLVRSLVWNDDDLFFDRLEGDVVADLGVRRLTVTEQRGERWATLYSVDGESEHEERVFNLPRVTGYDFPPFLLTPADDEVFDAHFAITCRDGVPRLLSVCRADPDRVFDAGELDSLITIANTIGALLDNQRLLKEDTLTGLANRLQCQRSLQSAAANVVRYRRRYTVVMLDLDHFKLVNDRHGHDVGDEVLRSLGKVLQAGLRSTDFVGRWGGEEFLLILDEAECEHARYRVRDLLDTFSRLQFEGEEGEFGVSFSAGIAALAPELSNADNAVSRADVAMYAAKTAGRQRVMIDAFSLN